MKKRVVVALIALAIVAAAACLAAGCESGNGAQAFEERYYKVTYVDGGQVIKEVNVKENALAENLDISGTKKGYEFVFWAFNDTEFNFNESIRRNVRLTAKWVPIKYTLTFYGRDNQKIAEVEYTVEDTDIDEPDVPEVEGYTGSWEEYAADGGNKDIRAVYEANTYTARFVVGDDIIEEIQYKTGESIEEPPVPPREGCIGRWEDYELKGDITVHAVYELAPEPSRGGETVGGDTEPQGGDSKTEPEVTDPDSEEKEPDISREPQNTDPSPDENEGNNKDKDDGETEPQTPPEESEDKGDTEDDSEKGGQGDIEDGQGETESGQQEETPEEDNDPDEKTEQGNDTDPPEDKDKDGQEGSQDPVPQEPKESRKPTEGLVFEEIDGGLMVTGYTGTDTEVYIPSEYNGSPVIEIGEYAFEESRVTAVEIADGIQLIGRYAFSSTLLTEVSLPDSVVEICDGAFWGCLNLKSLKLGAGLKKFGRNVIANCPELTGVEFAEPTGWRISSDKDGDRSDPVSPDLLSSPSSALDYLAENLKKYLLRG